MKKRLLSVALLMGAMTANAQVGIGTALPNKSAELLIESKNRGLLIPNVELMSTKDTKTITNGNVESLMVYAIKTQNDVTPGYYYWHIDRWVRLVADQDVPAIVVNQFEQILEMDGNKVENLIRNLIKSNESITMLSFDPKNGTLTYVNELQDVVTVPLDKVVQEFETVTAITADYDKGTLTFIDENGVSVDIDINDLVKETPTTLIKHSTGNYTYTNEFNKTFNIDVIGDVISKIQDVGDTNLYNVLKDLVKAEESLTSLVYNKDSKKLNYIDENGDSKEIEVDQLVKDHQIITEVVARKNISTSFTQEGNIRTYTLTVPTASADVAGVVKPGKGVTVDENGNLNASNATADTPGMVQPGNGVTVDADGKLNITSANLTSEKIIVVTDGIGSVLKETALSINEAEISLQNLGGILNLTQLQTGKAGDVLVVDKDGNPQWNPSPDVPTAGDGLVKNDTTGAFDVDYPTVKTALAQGTLSSNTINVVDGANAIFNDVTLEIKPGNQGQVLTTNPEGTGVVWADSQVPTSGDLTSISINVIGGSKALLSNASLEIAPGKKGQVLTTTDDGTGVFWADQDQVSLSGDVTVGADGDTTVTGIQGNPVSAKDPSAGNTLVFVNGEWVPGTPNVGVENITNAATLSTDGVIVIGDNDASSLDKAVLAATKLSVKSGAITTDHIADGTIKPEDIKGTVAGQVLGTDKDGKPTWVSAVSATNGVNLNTASGKNEVRLGGALDAVTAIGTSKENTLAITGLQTAAPTDYIVMADAKGVVKQIKAALPQFFYMPSIVLAATPSHITDGITKNITYSEGVYTADLYENYVAQFGGGDKLSSISSTSAKPLHVFKAEELDFHVTYYDNTLFTVTGLSAEGILTYTVNSPADVTVASFMNIVFSVK